MKPMTTLQDLIEEAKLRTVWWALCIFAVCYFLTHTSKSMWMNLPIAILLVAGLRILLNEVNFSWKTRNVRPQTYLSHLGKKQLSINDSRLSTPPPLPKWKSKVDSPLVEAAMEDFIQKILHDFVIDLWYSEITPDKEVPQLIHSLVMDVLGEISHRAKQINLADLLTRDVVNLIGDHLDLFRRNQASIGVDVMGTLSSEERDERLKHHLLASQELHPALISPECEYKVLQRLMSGVLATVLRPREAQSPLVRSFAREFLTCLVMQPLMNFASPGYINELIEYIFLAINAKGTQEAGNYQSPNSESHYHERSAPAESVDSKSKAAAAHNQRPDMTVAQIGHQRILPSDASRSSESNIIQDEPVLPQPADWARVLEAATQRRTEVLMPENLENMWAIGRHYKKKIQKNAAKGLPVPEEKCVISGAKESGKEITTQKPDAPTRMENKALGQSRPRPHPNFKPTDHINALHSSLNMNMVVAPQGCSSTQEVVDTVAAVSHENRIRLKRSNSTSDLHIQVKMDDPLASKGGPIISEFYTADFKGNAEVHTTKSASEMVLRSDGHQVQKLKCRVLGAYFEKLGSKSFAVYSIAVTNADNNTWFVKRRYSNFERLHRQLKDIPNYTLNLPPKRIFSSSTEDAFVHQRCIQLDKYLQELLSIANVAEQHEVWDFLSASSKNYSFGKSSSVMRTLAVNVDDAVDDIVRQFKGVSDGLVRKVVGSSSTYEPATAVLGGNYQRNLSWSGDEIGKLALAQSTSESVNSYSDNDDGDKDGRDVQGETESSPLVNGWHSDNELNSKEFPPRVIKHDEEFKGSSSESLSTGGFPEACLAIVSGQQLDPTRMPPEWTPPNLSVPVLNLVDNIFQLNRRGWLRRQVFWISKQILQLMMEDAIDDWLLRQIHWLRREDVIAHGIQWVQDVLWPNGTFFLKLKAQSETDDGQSNQGSGRSTRQASGNRASKAASFEEQFEAVRRANEVKKMLFDGAPTTLVSLIGHKQYRRCARDIYYFLQSTICLKQLAYGILELLLVTVFPELRELVKDIHERARTQPA
ncbi:PREDICTED: uncharacterized protein LOC109165730 isoform X2 [Ipomoea nil]|uniref:uncharacterized protein LOC109165730 isoform X2 n=1 Tax=Ipomoea nil TaxID=35883 RepID=UPI000900CA6D|nr:PREDICTED: uncharacterized protein LOC109165730 isoform X2 [Ipomoea nil]